MKQELVYKKYSEKAILIEWPAKIDEKTLQNLLNYKKSIENYYNELIVEVIIGYNSLLICYVYTINDIYSEFSSLKSLYNPDSVLPFKEKVIWEIPVCYSPVLAPDLEFFSKTKSLAIHEIISLHTAPIYTVYFIGFLPGFLYLGGMDQKLNLARKNTPSKHVQKGAVAIGGNQTGVYPADSPGGWHVIGMSPVDLFDSNSNTPCVISSGDLIQFISISEKEYNAKKTLIDTNNFTLSSRLL